MSITALSDTKTWDTISFRVSCCLVTKSCPAPRPHGLQHTRLLSPSLSHYLTQIHIHWVGDAIQPSHPLASPSPTFNLSQHQGLCRWVSSSHQVAKVLAFQFQHQSFQWIFSSDFLYDGLVGSPCSPKDSQEYSSTPQFKHQFFGTQLSLQSNSHIRTWLLEIP